MKNKMCDKTSKTIDEDILKKFFLKNDELVRLNISNANFKDFILHSLKKGADVESIGTLFEKSLEQMERKDKGQYYTPKEIVEYIISYLNIQRHSRVLDPACGCGSFLLAILDKLKKEYGEKTFRNIFGVDLNESAVKITQLSLSIKGGFNEKLLELFEKNIKIGNSIVSDNTLDKAAFRWEQEFKEIMKTGGFDFVVGNPPYVTIRKFKDFNPNESIYSSLICGPVNAATLMIGRSLDVLKDGGVLAFVLPKTISYVDSYSKLRKYLLDNTKIIHIFDLGQKFKDVRGEQIILIVKKDSQKDEKHKIKISIFDDKNKNLSDQPSFEIEQNVFLKFNKFLIFDNIEYYSLIQRIMVQGTILEDVVKGNIFRGIPIGGNSSFIKQTKTKNDEEVIRGKSITKFQIKEHLFINKKALENQSKTKINSLKEKKIVLQNIFSSESGIIAAYDDKGILTLDTVTNILTPNNENAKYLLALLNSKLINFFIMYGLFNRSRLTMHVDKSYLGKIPIVQISNKKILKSIITLVDKSSKTTNIDSIKENNRKIDKLVYKIYNLSKRDETLIDNAVNIMLSRKSRW